MLAWFQRCGHAPVALVGGATGRVGDPSGKSSERPVLPEVCQWNPRTQPDATRRNPTPCMGPCALLSTPCTGQRMLCCCATDVRLAGSGSRTALTLAAARLPGRQEQVEANVAAIRGLLERLLGQSAAMAPGAAAAGPAPPAVMNNIDWFGGMGLLAFLRDCGKFARVGVMLSKDSVKSRMGACGLATPPPPFSPTL